MKITSYVRIVLFSATIALGTVNAQTATDATSTPSTNNTRTDEGRGGFNPGWLGLLGLAGLMGLRKRDTHAYSGAGTATHRA
jgi:MYXO-CTERM domain-containing protein